MYHTVFHQLLWWRVTCNLGESESKTFPGYFMDPQNINSESLSLSASASGFNPSIQQIAASNVINGKNKKIKQTYFVFCTDTRKKREVSVNSYRAIKGVKFKKDDDCYKLVGHSSLDPFVLQECKRLILNNFVAESNKGRSEKKIYHLYYITNNSLREVSRETFKKVKGTMSINGNKYVKIVGGNRKDAVTMSSIKKSLLSFQTEGLLSDAFSSLKGLAGLGYVLEKLNEMVHAGIAVHIRNVVLDLMSLTIRIHELAKFNFKNFSISALIGVLIDLFRLKVDGGEVSSRFNAESAEAFALAGLTLLLPKELSEILKRMSLFTSDKLLDSGSLRDRFSIYDFIETFFDYITKFIEWLGCDKIKEWLQPVLDASKNKLQFFKLKSLLKIAESARKDPKILHNNVLRQKFLEDFNHLKSSHGMVEWSRRSATIKNYFDECSSIEKIINSYDKALRIEPGCFIFQGPPGVFKSVIMNAVIKHMDQPVYYHSVKAMKDGKDFYDNYNQEPIFCMDDLGAQGRSQWRTLMNMVSPVKLPLECAEVSLKDTKFFSSEIIMLTTNKFTTLHGFTETDCITEPSALFRRGYVFDFNVRRVGDLLTGRIEFQYFNTTNGLFVNEFPPEILNYLGNRRLEPSIIVNHGDPEQRATIVAWILDVITVFMNVKKRQRISNDAPLSSVNSKRLFKPETRESDYLDNIFKVLQDNPLEGVSLPDMSEGVQRLLRQATDYYEEDEQFLDAPAPLSPIFEESWDMSSTCSLSSQISNEGSLDSRKSYWKCVCEVMESTTEVIKSLAMKGVAYLALIGNTVKQKYKSMSNVVEQDSKYIGYYLVYMVLSTLFSIVVYKLVNRFTESDEKVATFATEVEEALPCTVAAINKQTLEADFTYINNEGKEIKCMSACVVSGHCLVTVYHNFIGSTGEIYCTVYKDRAKNHIMIDKLKYKIVFKSEKDDVAVLKNPIRMSSPFKNLSKHFKGLTTIKDQLIKQGYLVSTQGSTKMCTIKAAKDFPLVYQKGELFSNTVSDSFLYNVHGSGMCGSPIVDVELGITGMHVAGNSNLKLGCAIIWSSQTKQEISRILESDNQFLVDIPISPKVIEDFSGIKLDQKLHLSSPTKNNIQPTELHGIYPQHKIPSNMQYDNKHTIKTVGKKSFKPLKDVSTVELSFAKDVLLEIVKPFGDLTEEEVVKGTEFLAPLNKDSSNGFNCAKDKNVYVDFVNGKLTDRCKTETRELIDDIKKGIVNYEDWLWVESLKEETRDISKNGEPRSFRVGRIHSQILQKLTSGRMVENIIKERRYNGIALGVNPIKEWPYYYKQLKLCNGRHWASDISKWDGAMLSQVQSIVNEVLVSRYTGEHKELLEFLLNSMTHCFVGMNDDLFITTHSMPSGSFLTAVYNSLVNRAYTAMWYKRYAKKPFVTSFMSSLFDVVLGDDKLIGVLDQSEDKLTALTMLEFFQSIGLNCTTSLKKPVTNPFDSLEDLTFLKRTFRYHPILEKVVCPLDIKTIQSTIQWYNSKQDYQDVIKDKLHNFQREMFLHYFDYAPQINYVKNKCLERNVDFNVLPESYLIKLYNDEPDVWKYSSFSNVLYV